MEATKIEVKCPSCSTRYSLSDSSQSRKIQCRKCGKFIFLKGDQPSVARASAARPIPADAVGEAAAPRASKIPILPLVAVLGSLIAVVVLIKLVLTIL